MVLHIHAFSSASFSHVFRHFPLPLGLTPPLLPHSMVKSVQASVQSSFPAFSAEFEGRVPHMYLDIKGLVTVGVGNLADPIEVAQALPFRFKNRPGIDAPGSFATPDQIAAEWHTLKNDPSLEIRGFKACEPITRLELSDDSIDALILDRLTRN